jgi:hypothetical protein
MDTNGTANTHEEELNRRWTQMYADRKQVVHIPSKGLGGYSFVPGDHGASGDEGVCVVTGAEMTNDK